MDEFDQLRLAADAYMAYGRVTGNKNYQGLEMPKFLDLTAQIQAAWIAATQEVLHHTVIEITATGSKSMTTAVHYSEKRL